MSIEAENIEQDLTVKELLQEIINRLDILILHNEVITDEEFTEEDIEDGE